MTSDTSGSMASVLVRGATPVVFRGAMPTARVVSVGINPSIREFNSRSGVELVGEERRFETLNSLGLTSMDDADEAMRARIHQRCLDYFTNNPYVDWFAPMEFLIHGITGASFFDGSAYHLDLVHRATDPLWGGLEATTKRELLRGDRPAVIDQLRNPSLEIIYLNGRTVCEEVGRFIPLRNRTAHFGSHSAQRRFHRGWFGDAMVVGCSSNVQGERLKAEDRPHFMQWIINECGSDLDSLRAPT